MKIFGEVILCGLTCLIVLVMSMVGIIPSVLLYAFFVQLNFYEEVAAILSVAITIVVMMGIGGKTVVEDEITIKDKKIRQLELQITKQNNEITQWKNLLRN